MFKFVIKENELKELSSAERLVTTLYDLTAQSDDVRINFDSKALASTLLIVKEKLEQVMDNIDKA